MIGTSPNLESIRLTDGRSIKINALFLAHTVRMNPLADQLGCAFEEGPIGPYIRTDATKMTTIPGVYGGGDAATAMWNATFASADGVMAGVALHRSLVFGMAA